MGKKIVVTGADWSSVKISNLAYKIDLSKMDISQSKKLYVWFVDEHESNLNVTSNDSTILSVGNRVGEGTEFNPYVYTLTAVSIGTATITITSDSTTRTFQQTVEDSEIPSGYTRYNAIRLDNTADSTVYCDVEDIQLSHNYKYEFRIRKGQTTKDSVPIFGVRGAYNASDTYNNSRKAFALFVNTTTGSPSGAKLGYWWNGCDSDPMFNAVPVDGGMCTITVTPNNTLDAIFSSTYNAETVNVTATLTIKKWAMGFAFFSYRFGQESSGSYHPTDSAKNISIGTTTIRDSNDNIIYKFIPVKSPDNKYGYYESITKKFYGFNENTEHYDSISGETE